MSKEYEEKVVTSLASGVTQDQRLYKVWCQLAVDIQVATCGLQIRLDQSDRAHEKLTQGNVEESEDQSS